MSRYFSFTPWNTYDGGSFTALDVMLTWQPGHTYADGHRWPARGTLTLCVLGLGFSLTYWPGGKYQ